METVLLICEAFIALFGVYAVIIADNTHERLHGLFVVGLALEGFLARLVGEEHILTVAVLIILTIIAVLMIVLSTHSLITHLKKYFGRQTASFDATPSLKIDGSIDTQNLCILMEKRFDKIEEMLSKREKELEEREKALLEREKRIIEEEK